MQRLLRQDRLRFEGRLADARPQLPSLLKRLSKMEWVVYAKPPFGGPAQVIEYLGRYTHRVAISNHRLLQLTDNDVSFLYKDYRLAGRNQSKQMTLAIDEFIRRFLLHTLPPGFSRIRHYGLLAGRTKNQLLPICRALLQAGSPLPLPKEIAEYIAQFQTADFKCSQCGVGQMIRAERIAIWRAFQPIPDT